MNVTGLWSAIRQLSYSIVAYSGSLIRDIVCKTAIRESTSCGLRYVLGNMRYANSNMSVVCSYSGRQYRFQSVTARVFVVVGQAAHVEVPITNGSKSNRIVALAR